VTSSAGWNVDRRSALPYYLQLKQALLARISSDEFAPGDRIPGEMELCESYDVSRTVVRQALLELEHEGVLRREKGRGTFVQDAHSSRGIGGALVGTFEDIQSGTGEQHSRVTRRGIVAASASVSRDLRLRPGSSVVEIERVREVDGRPWAVTRTQLPLEIGGPLLEADLEDVSLFGILERQFGIRFERAQRSVEAGLPSSEVAAALGTLPTDPVLIMRSLSFDQAGAPIERFTGYHRGDLSRLDIVVTREARS